MCLIPQVRTMPNAQTHIPSAASKVLDPSSVHTSLPELGPLGNYLMARWRIQVAAQQVYHPAFRENKF